MGKLTDSASVRMNQIQKDRHSQQHHVEPDRNSSESCLSTILRQPAAL